jgi:tRNA 2-thiocytidine biosynthesis protein TtcA
MLDQDDDIHPLFAGAPRTTEFKKLRKRIVRQAREAIDQYGMVDRGPGGWSACLAARIAMAAVPAECTSIL